MRARNLVGAAMVAVGGAVAALVVGTVGAGAVSTGSYSSPQQDCPWYASDWNTPPDTVYPGCHNVQVSLESGGTTGGNPNDGWNDSPTAGGSGQANTTWVQLGNDQSPNDPRSAGTPTLLSVAYPGQSGAPHAGCLSVNTDGTGGGPAPENPSTFNNGGGSNAGEVTPEAPPRAYSQNRYGCGNNPHGSGFSLVYDLYDLYDGIGYCTVGTYLNGVEGGDPCGRMANGQSDAGTTSLTPDVGTRQNLTTVASKGLILYTGIDDNVDSGEHDGEGPYSSPLTDGSINGPSDGGGITVSLTPQHATARPTAANPEGLANLSAGGCADGNCVNLTTQRQVVYQGCGANTGENQAADQCPPGRSGSSRDAADYGGVQWDPYQCSSGGVQTQPASQPQADSPAECDTSPTNPSPTGTANANGGEDYWRQQEPSQVVAEPGVQLYEDPDPQGSPATPLYPDPAAYVGTCGVVVGGGGTSSAGDPTGLGLIPNRSLSLPAGTPATNSAGQLDLSPTGC